LLTRWPLAVTRFGIDMPGGSCIVQLELPTFAPVPGAFFTHPGIILTGNQHAGNWRRQRQIPIGNGEVGRIGRCD
jgi:hypothetical protein